MPINKDALSRYRIIDEAMHNRQHKYPTKLELIALIEKALGNEISVRTLEEDFRNMRSNEDLNYFAPIEYYSKHKGYAYTDENYSITGIPISKNDLEKLKYAISIFSQFEGIPYLSEIFQPIEQLNRIIHVGKSTGQWVNNSVVQIEAPIQWPDKTMFEQFVNSIINKKEVQIAYQAFGKEKTDEFLIHPYLIKEYKNRWYIIALNVALNEIRIYGLDRIVSISEMNSNFIESFDHQTYFKHALGITVHNNTKPVQIELLFSNEDAPYILSNRIHATQKVISHAKNGLKISLTLHPSYELTMLIRSYGSGVKVIKPKWLKDEILADAKKVLAN